MKLLAAFITACLLCPLAYITTTPDRTPDPPRAVVIVDTGIRSTHHAVESNFLGGIDMSGSGTLNDKHGHGTAMADLVVRQNPKAAVWVVKVTREDSAGTTHDDMQRALEWVRDTDVVRATCVLLAFGGGHVQTPRDTPLRDVIGELRALDIPVVVCAGNWHEEEVKEGNVEGMSEPAIFPETVSVGATQAGNYLPEPWSGRITVGESRTDVFTPGRFFVAGSLSDDFYQPVHGTSCSAAVVAGAISALSDELWTRRRAWPTVDEIEAALRWRRNQKYPVLDTKQARRYLRRVVR